MGIALLIGPIVLVLFYIWVFVAWHKSKREKEKAIEEALTERRDFTESKVIKGRGGQSYYLATDEKRKKIFYVFGEKKLLCDFKDVVAVDIIQDGETVVSKQSMAGAFGGAIIGRAVLGNDAGAFIGAATLGTSTSQSQISKLSVHVLLRNQPLSSLDFVCYNMGGVTIPQTNYMIEYKNAREEAQSIYDLFRLVIDEVQREGQRLTAQSKNRSVQELKDLAELHKQGLIDAEEFAKMKSRIVNNN